VQIYNTLTRRKEEFTPLEPGHVRMYGCGPTVYNVIHVGNARTFCTYDMIVRYLRWRGYRVTFVRNITDIDDKIINAANEQGVPWQEIVGRYLSAFHEDLAALGTLPPDVEPRATDTVPEIIAAVQCLLDRGLAYETDGDVWFSVRERPDYGKLSGRNMEELMAGARVEVDERKRDPLDFALWKAAKPGEPAWDSPWGPGRPGWHIECTAMAIKYLGEQIDIHAGASDLIFPHHENEIAQSEGCTGRAPFVRYWVHGGFLTVNRQRMGKSMGNFFTVREVLGQYRPEVLRLLYLNTHYRNELEFSGEVMEAARGGFERLQVALQQARTLAGAAAGEGESRLGPLETALAQARNEFTAAMDDDFNTPRALSAVYELAGALFAHTEGPFAARAVEGEVLGRVADTISELAGTLGLGLAAARDVTGLRPALAELAARMAVLAEGEVAASLGQVAAADSAGGMIDRLLQARQLARAEKQWPVADGIRKALGSLGIILEDHPQGTTWRQA